MFEVTFHPDIAKEVKFSYNWYQNQAEGLGDDFLSELETAYQTIIQLPDTWPMFQKGFRRFLLRKFPFSIIYRLNGKTIFIVAIMHNSRKPNYWLKRA
ncbi:MAG: type II toxin-antitoxin system RelE/ParE family toxin [Methylococcales bacterium]|nr:type II toxin-antitoxin system RelE/ParE family toxin [Methylococcales bacterium]